MCVEGAGVIRLRCTVFTVTPCAMWEEDDILTNTCRQ